MRKIPFVLALAVAAASMTSSASAQGVDRKGIYGDIGVNYTMGLNAGVITGESGAGISQSADVAGFTAAIGYGLKNNMWRLGIQGDMYKQSDVFGFGGVDATVTMITLAATYYPSEKNHFWARLNLGYAQDKLSGGGAESGTSTGFGGGFGVGYDWMLGKGSFALTPYLNYRGQFSGGDFGGDFTGAKARSSVMQIGVTIGYKH